MTSTMTSDVPAVSIDKMRLCLGARVGVGSGEWVVGNRYMGTEWIVEKEGEIEGPGLSPRWWWLWRWWWWVEVPTEPPPSLFPVGVGAAMLTAVTSASHTFTSRKGCH
jgi:hypothetical protein